jgi:hypothetical protein
MNTIDKALLAYYKLCNARREEYKQYYKHFNIYSTILGDVLISKN